MTEESKLSEERRSWWERWTKLDYSWTGLAKHIVDGTGEFGELTVQDYWRRDPETGSMRTDDELQGVGELVQSFDGRLWHVAHLPLEFFGNRAKSAWSDETKEKLIAILRKRLAVATDRSDTWRDGGPGVDGRAQFQGIVIPVEFKPLLGPFGINIDASNSFWSDRVLLDEVFSMGAVCFDGAWFETRVTFENSILGHGTSFNEAIFAAGAVFDDVIFSGHVEFSKTRFLWYAEFRRARFYDTALFRGSKFADFALFTESEFRDTGDFRDCTFDRHAGFARTKWRRHISFQNVELHEDSTFDRLSCLALQGPIRWISLQFFVLALVIGLICVGWVFQLLPGWLAIGALFALFAWSTVRPFIQLPSLEYFRRPWIAKLFPEDEELERLIRELRSLTLICEASRNRRDAAKFARLELTATRLRASTGPFERGLSCLYDWTAGYGESLPRPVITLVMATFVFASIYWAWDAEGFGANRRGFWTSQSFPTAVSSQEFGSAIEFSARNVFRPFAVWGTMSQSTDCSVESRLLAVADACTNAPVPAQPPQRLWVQVLATVQSLISIALVFLFGLALRRRFQVGS